MGVLDPHTERAERRDLQLAEEEDGRGPSETNQLSNWEGWNRGKKP